MGRRGGDGPPPGGAGRPRAVRQGSKGLAAGGGPVERRESIPSQEGSFEPHAGPGAEMGDGTPAARVRFAGAFRPGTGRSGERIRRCTAWPSSSAPGRIRGLIPGPPRPSDPDRGLRGGLPCAARGEPRGTRRRLLRGKGKRRSRPPQSRLPRPRERPPLGEPRKPTKGVAGWARPWRERSYRTARSVHRAAPRSAAADGARKRRCGC